MKFSVRPFRDRRIRTQYVVSRANNPEGVVDLRTPVALEAQMRAESLATLGEPVVVIRIQFVRMGAEVTTYVIPPPPTPREPLGD